jgi:hypothetical protein
VSTRYELCVDSLMLKDIEMAPSHFLGVVGRTVRRATGRPSKATTRGEVDLADKPACLGGRSRCRSPARADHPAPTQVEAERCHAWLALRTRSILFKPGVVLAAIKDVLAIQTRGGLRPSLTVAPPVT